MTVGQNFDSVLIPENHVARDKKDNYYINKDYMLRAHTSAHQVDMLKQGLNAFLCTGDVYRRDTIDRTHYPVFHQMEGLRIFSRDELFGHQLGHMHIETPSDIEDFSIFDSKSQRTSVRQENLSIEASYMIEKDLKQCLEKLVMHLFGDDVEFRYCNMFSVVLNQIWPNCS